MSDQAPRYRGACHCKAVQFTVTAPDGLTKINRCNCSICRMRGAVVTWAWADGGMEITQGADKLTLYKFNTGVASHYFCSVCGIYTHHQRRAEPDKFSVNVACLEGVSPFDFPDVPVVNGQQHSKDVTGPRKAVSGRVQYVSNE